MELILNIVLIIIVAKLLAEPLRRAGIHSIVGDVLAGLILGPAILGIVQPDTGIKALADFSLIILMLYTGLTSNLRVLGEQKKKIIVTGVSGALTTFTLVFSAAMALGYPLITALFIAVALSNTATETVAAMLERMEHKLPATTHSILIGASFVDDVLAVYLITLLRVLPTTGTIDFYEFTYITIEILAFMVIVLYASKIIMEKYGSRVTKFFADPARMTVTTVMLAFILALIAKLIGLNEVIGAYLGGLAVSRLRTIRDPTLLGVIRIGELTDELRIMLESLLTTIFFAYVGLNYNPGTLVNPLVLIVFLSLALLGKFIGCSLPLLAMKTNKYEAIIIGVGMGGRGALETAIILFAQQYGLITASEYALILTVMLGTAIITPILFGLTLRKYAKRII